MAYLCRVDHGIGKLLKDNLSRYGGKKGTKEMYTSKHYVGEIIYLKSAEITHECKVTRVWVDPDNNKSGVSIIPTGNYGFEIDVYDDVLERKLV